jgi:gluconokinase
MFEVFVSALDELVASVAPGDVLGGVATSSLAANVLAIDESGGPLTPSYLYSDTRNAGAVEELRARFDWRPIYARTGCPLHTSYLPARLWWLRKTQPDVFARASRFISLHEFFLSRLFGRTIISHSLASWTGLLNHLRLDWDDELLQICNVRREQLSPLARAKDSVKNLNEEYSARWRLLAEVPFFPAIGDGAAANIGSGCTEASRVAISIGTSGAMRVVIPAHGLSEIPEGLWLYAVDERRALLGGSLNNGGNVFAYLKRTFQLRDLTALERELEALEPDGHGLTVLPFFAGERSPGYRARARAAIVGLNLGTAPVEIVRAVYEAIAYRFSLIYQRMQSLLPDGHALIASGSALYHSAVWVQILADVLGRPVTVSGEEEASARGATVMALEALGLIADAAELAPAFGQTFTPNMAHHEIYSRALQRHQQLYSLLVEGRER